MTAPSEHLAMQQETEEALDWANLAGFKRGQRDWNECLYEPYPGGMEDHEAAAYARGYRHGWRGD